MAAIVSDVIRVQPRRYFPFLGRIDMADSAQGNASPIRLPVARDEWTARFTCRLAELRQDVDTGSLFLSAAGLFTSVGHFNPEIAAEMEYEIGRAEH